MKLIKVIFIFITITLFLNKTIYCQSNAYYVNLYAAMQKVDDRLVGLTERDVARFKKMNEEKSNNFTMQIGFEMGFDIFSNNYFSITGGLNYSYERSSYIRLFYWQALLSKDAPRFDIPRYLDVNSYHLAGSNIGVNFELINAKNYLLKMGFNIIPVIRFQSFYKEALVTHQKRVWNKVDYFSTEFNPFVGLRYRDVELDFYYRIFQIKKIDRAIFTKYNTGYGAIENDFEIYNPVKFGVSVKYWFNLFKRKSNEKSKDE